MPPTATIKGNFVSEWFGHRLFPTVVSTAASIGDQRAERCPFLSDLTGETRSCFKNQQSRGVCTIRTHSASGGQDWLVCPYRVLSPDLVEQAVRQLFRVKPGSALRVVPAVNLAKIDVREDVGKRLEAGELVFIFFDAKLGGELSMPATDRSPEFSFDVTIVELKRAGGAVHIDRFGILEVQTMDFHGSYKAAVRNLQDGLRLHPRDFAATVSAHPEWLSEDVEGPNIANVFKRTFYQMMFKFQLGKHPRCAGCVLAIPASVWESWQRHLGAPALKREKDGSYSLFDPKKKPPDAAPAWIYVFDTDASKKTTPTPIVLSRAIATDAPGVSHWALDIAPQAALASIDSATGFMTILARRLRVLWPELARTIQV